jgi:hypothetical protein
MRCLVIVTALSAGLALGAVQMSFAQESGGAKGSGTGAAPSGTPAADNKTDNMPKTNLKETVIPKSGGSEKPVEGTPKGETK